MSDIEIIKLVFGIYLLIGGIVLLIFATYFHKYVNIEKKCQSKTTGIVVGYSAHRPLLPRVRYYIDGKEYKVTSPLFRGVYSLDISAPWIKESKQEWWEDGKHRLHIKRKGNSHARRFISPIMEKYPKGTELPVFYCEDKPKLSYVLRDAKLGFIFYMLLFIAIAVFALDAYIVFIL